MQNLKTSENQDTKWCIKALEQDPNFATGHEPTSLPITSNPHKQPHQYPPGIFYLLTVHLYVFLKVNDQIDALLTQAGPPDDEHLMLETCRGMK